MQTSPSYTETNHRFKPGKLGRVGWKYDNPIDISDYQYLVVKLLTTTTVGSVYIFPSKVKSVYFQSATFDTLTAVTPGHTVRVSLPISAPKEARCS